jgi:hypothetical protein
MLPRLQVLETLPIEPIKKTNDPAPVGLRVLPFLKFIGDVPGRRGDQDGAHHLYDRHYQGNEEQETIPLQVAEQEFDQECHYFLLAL